MAGKPLKPTYAPLTEEQARALALRAEALMLGLQPGVGLVEAANRLNLPVEELLTWHRVATSFGLLDIFRGVGSANFANGFEAVARMALAHVTPEKLIKASAKDCLDIADRAVKNMQLLRGQATEIPGTVDDKALVDRVRLFAEQYGVDAARKMIAPQLAGPALAALETMLQELDKTIVSSRLGWVEPASNEPQ